MGRSRLDPLFFFREPSLSSPPPKTTISLFLVSLSDYTFSLPVLLSLFVVFVEKGKTEEQEAKKTIKVPPLSLI